MTKGMRFFFGFIGVAAAALGIGFFVKKSHAATPPGSKSGNTDPAAPGGNNAKSSTPNTSNIPAYTGSDKTWDPITDKNIERMHPDVRPYARKFINQAYKQGIKLRATSTLRTYAEQAALYAQGRTDKSKPKVTNAQPGESSHNFGTGMDVVPIVDGKADWNYKDWNKIGQIGKSVGFAWGGDWKSFKDLPHFEMNFGLTLAQVRSRYESGKKKGEYVIFA